MLRVLTMILVPAVLGLWGYFLAEVAPLDGAAPVPVREDEGTRGPAPDLSAATLNNEGVRLARAGRQGDALEYLKRARDFRPLDPVIARNAARQEARVKKAGWARVLGLTTLFAVLDLLVAGIWHVVRRLRDRERLHRLRLSGDPWFVIPREGDRAELPLRFSEPLDGLVRRHPLTIVWSSARHGKHMKSRPPVAAEGRGLTVKLEGERLERLRRYPGDWRGFLYLGRTPVGEAAAKVI
jgi:hypothetical protein